MWFRYIGTVHPESFLVFLLLLLSPLDVGASYRIDSFPTAYTTRIESSFFHRGFVQDSGKPVRPMPLAFGQVLYRYNYGADYVLYSGEVVPDVWHDMDFFKIPDSLPDRLTFKYYRVSNTVTDAPGVYFTEGYVCVQNAARLYFYRGDRKDSVEREPIKPTLARITLRQDGGTISIVDGRSCRSPCLWISDGAPFFTAAMDAPGHYRRTEFHTLDPGRVHRMEFSLVPVFSPGVLDSLIQARSLEGSPRGLGEAEARRRERETRLFRDSLVSKRAEVALELDRTNPKPDRMAGEGWFAFRKRKKEWRVSRAAGLQRFDILVASCEKTLEELKDWSIASDCVQDTLHLDPRDVVLEKLSDNGKEARVRFHMDRRPFWFDFLGLLPVDAAAHARLKAAWTSGQLQVRALFWSGAKVSAGDSAYHLGLTRLEVRLDSVVREIRHGFTHAPELTGGKDYDRAIRDFERWGQRCGERLCRGFWPCHWGKVAAGGALTAAAAAGGYCYSTNCFEPDPELKTYQVDIEFE